MNRHEFEHYFNQKPQMRIDRWIAFWLVIGAIFWACLYEVVK